MGQGISGDVGPMPIREDDLFHVIEINRTLMTSNKKRKKSSQFNGMSELLSMFEGMSNGQDKYMSLFSALMVSSR